MPMWFGTRLPMTAHNGVFRGEIRWHKTLFDINSNSISAIAWNNRLQQHQRQQQSEQLRNGANLTQIRNIVSTLRTNRLLPTTTTTTIADDKLKPAIILATVTATKATLNTIQWIPMKFAILFELATDFFSRSFPFLTLRAFFPFSWIMENFLSTNRTAQGDTGTRMNVFFFPLLRNTLCRESFRHFRLCALFFVAKKKLFSKEWSSCFAFLFCPRSTLQRKSHFLVHTFSTIARESTLCVLNCISTFATKAIKSDLKRTNSFSQRCVHFIFSFTSTRFFHRTSYLWRAFFDSSFKTSSYYMKLHSGCLSPSLSLPSLFCAQYTCNHAKSWWREKEKYFGKMTCAR